MRFKRDFNPFYVLLVVAGTAFCLTACAYGVMAMREMRPQLTLDKSSSAGPHKLMAYLERDGERLLIIELAVLAVASFAAMGTDDYWQRRAAAKSEIRKPESRSEIASPTEEN